MKARPLPDGGTIGVAAASSPFEERSEIDRSIRWYEERGYRVRLADGVYARDDYVAGDAAARARDVNALFADPEVDLIQLRCWKTSTASNSRLGVAQSARCACETMPVTTFSSPLIATNPDPITPHTPSPRMALPARSPASVG